jgi:Zn-dependent protease
MLDLLSSNPLYFVLVLICLILSLSIHEFFHAYVAFKLGDITPKLQGRVTLNPLAHIDIYGLILLIVAGFGWGKPVEYDVYNLKNPKRDVLLISFSGPLSNLILAIVFMVLVKFLGANPFFYQMITLNLVLGVFNLLPIYPLDGFNVVTGLLPYNLAYRWKELDKYGVYILIIFLLTNAYSYTVLPIVSMILNFLNFLI